MSDYLAPCPEPGCRLAITTVNGLAPGGVCPAHGHPDSTFRSDKADS